MDKILLKQLLNFIYSKSDKIVGEDITLFKSAINNFLDYIDKSEIKK